MGYRKVYRTVDEQTTKKMVKMLQRHGIMAYGKAKEPEKFCRLQLEYRIRDALFM